MYDAIDAAIWPLSMLNIVLWSIICMHYVHVICRVDVTDVDHVVVVVSRRMWSRPSRFVGNQMWQPQTATRWG